MPISASTLASVRTKRGIGTALKDRRADAAVRLATVRERHGAGACDVIEMIPGGRYETFVGLLRGETLVGLARSAHGSGRMKRIADGVWVVFEG